MIITIEAFSEVLKEVAAQHQEGCDGVFCNNIRIIDDVRGLHFVAGTSDQLRVLENLGPFEEEFTLHDVREVLETMTSIKKGVWI